MARRLDLFEQLIVSCLIVMMALVVLIATLELAWLIVDDLRGVPLAFLGIDELLDIFGFFLLVLIGVELLGTLRLYFEEHIVHAEVVLEVGMIAIARKVIVADVNELASTTLVGIAAIVLALAAAYTAVKLSLGARPAALPAAPSGPAAGSRVPGDPAAGPAEASDAGSPDGGASTR